MKIQCIKMKPQNVKEIYRKRAKLYNFTSNLYSLLGVRDHRYRENGIASLGLKPGATVIELGCGTGKNFSYLQKHIGPAGKIIGVDLTDAMLNKARERVKTHKWANVEFIEANAITFQSPVQADAIISTYAISIMPDPVKVIENSIKFLKPRGQFLILDLQVPDHWLSIFAGFFLAITRPYAITKEWIDARYWKALEEAFRKNFKTYHKQDYFLGYLYTMLGQKE